MIVTHHLDYYRVVWVSKNLKVSWGVLRVPHLSVLVSYASIDMTCNYEFTAFTLCCRKLSLKPVKLLWWLTAINWIVRVLVKVLIVEDKHWDSVRHVSSVVPSRQECFLCRFNDLSISCEALNPQIVEKFVVWLSVILIDSLAVIAIIVSKRGENQSIGKMLLNQIRGSLQVSLDFINFALGCFT